MPADRFYINAELPIQTTLFLEGPEHHHLANVMRLNKGEEVELVNGRGGLATGMIQEVNKKGVSIEILTSEKSDDHPPRIFLAVPLMRAAKLEWIVEKGTELGASAFLFYSAKYSEKEELNPRQMERLHLLTISALKQSGRLYLPSIEIHSDLQSLFIKEALFLFGDTRPAATVDLAKLKTDSIVFVTGPERGFSQEELALLETKGKGVRLSPFTLRAETAPIAAASILGTQRIV